MKRKNLLGLFLLLGINIIVFVSFNLKVCAQEPFIKKKESPKVTEPRIVNKGDAYLLKPAGHFSYWSHLDSAGDYKDYEFLSGEGVFACTLSSIPEYSDYDLYLYNCKWETLDSSIYPGNSDEDINHWVTTGLYYVRVSCWSGGDSTDTYHLYGNHPDPTDAPDLRILSIASSDSNPIIGEYITITTEIINFSSGNAPYSQTALYKNLDTPPQAPICWLKDYLYFTGELGPFEHRVFTQDLVTSYDTSTWHMYGLVDCDDEVTELNDCNNTYGPFVIVWREPMPKPDLEVPDVTPSSYSPYGANYDYLYTDVTVQNTGDTSAGAFWTDIFYDIPYAPTPPASGDDGRYTSYLAIGGNKTYTFVERNDTGYSETWSMYVLVDAQGKVSEEEEGNNVNGPKNIYWHPKSPPYPTRTRDQIINTAEEFANIWWEPSPENTLKPSECYLWEIDPDNNIGVPVQGVAYEWAGWDRPADFLKLLDLQYNSAEYFKPGTYDSIDCTTQGDPFWAIGCDCSGLVSRAWDLSYHCNTSCLANYASYQLGDIDSLLRGDIMNDPGNHVAIFFDWAGVDTMEVIEETHPRAIKSKWHSSKYNNYIPYRYNNVQETTLKICGDANGDGYITIGDVVWLINYLFKGGPAPDPLCKANVNGDSIVSISDIVYLINYLFGGGPLPVTPCCPEY